MNTPPVAGGEQTNIPRNDAELAAATAKRIAADAREQQAHEEARNMGEAKRKQQMIGQAHYNLQAVLFEIAELTGNGAHHVNATLHSAAVLLANCTSPVDEARMIEFIQKRAIEIREVRRASTPAANEPTTDEPKKGE